MTNVLSVERQATLVITVLMCSITIVRSSATLPKTAPMKSLHWEHLATATDHIPSHAMTTTIEIDHSPLTTDTAMEDTLTGHDHTTDPTVTKALATTEDMHPAPNPTAIAVCAIL